MSPLHVAVEGEVQGVGFRWFVRERARRLGLRGWVRNRSDGSVEVLADGAEESLAQLRRHLEQGPSGAVVRMVRDVNGHTDEPLAEPFTIVR